MRHGRAQTPDRTRGFLEFVANTSVPGRDGLAQGPLMREVEDLRRVNIEPNEAGQPSYMVST